MVDITLKSYTLRKAIAQAEVLVSSLDTIKAIEEKKVPKGDIFEFARAASLLAIKKTSDLIPDCHPLPVEFAQVSYAIEGLCLQIYVEVHTIYKTGVEVEAMHGASLAALVIYDMLKPIDKGVEIQHIKLLKKTGGKSDDTPIENLSAEVIVCSDTVSEGVKVDSSGLLIKELLEKDGIRIVNYAIVADQIEAIQNAVIQAKNKGISIIILTGGTGLSDRDVTPEAVKPLLTKEIPGIMETARNFGQQRIKTAMLSRSIAGFSDHSLILTFPGSNSAVLEYYKALFPQVFHVFDLNKRH
jgi:cyclic pyranopterin phosphate synthase